ncbi:MAG: TIGR03617 family F420-dependent LLM class oxidoreductase [Deltaproteobacteria bacterium]|nr:TIGR03617 family F420-dependent LLM class oxidoreductase [Deltaproteobacteria bacterium]
MKIDAALLQTELEASGRIAKEYEDQGYDGVLSFEGTHDPFLPLALAAALTERIDLITGIAIAFARNPMVVAYMANDLQLLSKGRFVLGLGSQIRPHIEKRFSETWSRPNARMREFVQAIRAIWRCWNEGERLQFRGEFYTHTLMSPFFSPSKNPFGVPRIALAGFGPGMIRVAGEVADGWIVHPLHSPDFVRVVGLPALAEGASRGGRDPKGVEISAQTITMIGANDEQIERARQKARAQMSFYGSTPAYKIFLDHHGWGDLQPELNRLSKEGKWLDMTRLITDEMVDVVGVSGTPDQVAKRIRERNAFAQRTTMVVYNEAGPDALQEVVRKLRG